MTPYAKGQIALTVNAATAGWVLMEMILRLDPWWKCGAVTVLLGLSFVLGRHFARQESKAA